MYCLVVLLLFVCLLFADVKWPVISISFAFVSGLTVGRRGHGPHGHHGHHHHHGDSDRSDWDENGDWEKPDCNKTLDNGMVQDGNGWMGDDDMRQEAATGEQDYKEMMCEEIDCDMDDDDDSENVDYVVEEDDYEGKVDAEDLEYYKRLQKHCCGRHR